MRLSIKCDYAARAVLGLARIEPPGRSMQVRSLAQQESIPQAFLSRILVDLRKGGLVRSLRGRGGGYALARDPGEITLADVLRCVEEDCFGIATDDGCPAALREEWARLQADMERAAAGIDFQAIMERSRPAAEMYYI